MPTHSTHEPSADRLRVLIVDDSELFRTGLQALLSSEGLDVANAASGEEALRHVHAFRPAVVVMDMGMPGMSGSQAARRILDIAPETFVMMLTGSEGADVLEAVRAGASGYVLKAADLSEIVKAIRATAAGQSPFAPQVAGALLATVRESALAGVCPPDPGVALSTREREVLALLAHGCSNAEIAQRLFISPSTVKNQISALLVKLHVDNRTKAACVAIRAGLVDDSVSIA
jgi:DNA-binding NarL/FixJ family response regulator